MRIASASGASCRSRVRDGPDASPRHPLPRHHTIFQPDLSGLRRGVRGTFTSGASTYLPVSSRGFCSRAVALELGTGFVPVRKAAAAPARGNALDLGTGKRRRSAPRRGARSEGTLITICSPPAHGERRAAFEELVPR